GERFELQLLDRSLALQLAQVVLTVDARLVALVVLDRRLALQPLHGEARLTLVETQDRFAGRHGVPRLVERLQDPRGTRARDHELVLGEYQPRSGERRVDRTSLDLRGAELCAREGRSHPPGDEECENDERAGSQAPAQEAATRSSEQLTSGDRSVHATDE